MTESSPQDVAHMSRALELAERGRFTARPNPIVGCVVVRDGSVVGEGWHVRAGEPHAEVNALADAGGARGATVYVTLEPCTHHGRTPPCADALIEARVAEVVIGALDPSDVVDGAGIAALQAAGIKVRSGLLVERAESQNRGFLSRIRRQQPWVTLKVAASIDGATAMKNGESQWITSQDSRLDVQRLRAASGAIITGIGTVVADDPSLNVRDESIPADVPQPIRAVIDSSLRMPAAARMLSLEGETVVYCVDDAGREELEAAGASVMIVERSADGRVVLTDVLRDLAVNRHVNDVLVEAGPGLAGSMIEAELVDELVIYQAPHIMGSETMPMFGTPSMTALAERVELDFDDVRRIGPDMKITARIRRSRSRV